MTDPYLLLSLPQSFYLEPNAIEEAFRRIAAMHHPDQASGSTASFQELQEAVAILRDPSKRLRYLAGVPQGISVPLPEAATALFPIIVASLQKSDSLIKKYQAAQGILIKATMMEELVNTLQEIRNVLDLVQQWQESLQQKLRDLDATGSKSSSEALLELANSFNFAQRWDQQLREKEITFTTLLG